MLKRFFDLLVAAAGLIVLLPLLLVVGIAIKLDSEGPVVYKGARIGKDGKPFQILKLRTMVLHADRMGSALTQGGDPRITRVGRVLRKWKIDEFPQLINVLRGEMSLVGPRPESPGFVERYSAEQRRVLDVRPGITGLAQVRYRDEETLLRQSSNPEADYLTTIMPQKLALDLTYVDNQSLLLDLQLIFQTFACLVNGAAPLELSQPKRPVLHAVLLVALLPSLMGAGWVMPAQDEDPPAYARQVRVLETAELGLVHPTGLAYQDEAKQFLVLEAGTAAQARFFMVSPFEKLVGISTISVPLIDPLNVAFDSRFGRLLAYVPATDELIAVATDAAGRPRGGPGDIVHYPAGSLGLGRPSGMSVDGETGHLFVVDADSQELARIEPGPHGEFAGTAAAETIVSRTSWKHTGVQDPRGLALDPETGHFHVISPSQRALFEISEAGEVVARRDLASLGLVDPQGLVLAPSGDPTDDPAKLHMFVADRGLETAEGPPSGRPPTGLPEMAPVLTGTAVDATPGRIVELSFEPPPQRVAGASDVAATLVRTTETSLYVPPSPDPAALAYLNDSGTLLIADSEVSEMPQYFTGDNLFEVTLSGELLDTTSAMDFTDEPTGVAYDPTSSHMFFTDDDRTRIFVRDPGLDELHGTADDIVTDFESETFGSQDPEGIAYDRWQGHLFVVDGLGEEVYEISPGTNGIFDGVPPEGDDVIAHFDTTALGVTDPEGVEFNVRNGHLFVLSHTSDVIAETLNDGTLVGYVDIAGVGAWLAGGLAQAPASSDPGLLNMYIADRGVDNNQDPDENDGKLYEISFLPLDSGCTEPDGATLSAAIDGGTVRLSWPGVSGAEVYNVYRSANAPYVTPAVPYAVAGASPWHDPDSAAVGDGVDNYFYTLRAASTCGEALDSNLVGEFDFELVPGTP